MLSFDKCGSIRDKHEGSMNVLNVTCPEGTTGRYVYLTSEASHLPLKTNELFVYIVYGWAGRSVI